MHRRVIVGSVVMALCVTVAVSSIAFADMDEGEYGMFERTSTVPPVMSKQYETECGSCHFAYQAGWLPARSWKKLMGTLDQHFGENAELDQTTRDKITAYLTSEAADVRQNRKSQKILRSVSPDEVPVRISTLRYITHKHDEIPKRFIEGNAKVGSRANCAACHTGAASGNFNEHGVTIPGHGRWDD